LTTTTKILKFMTDLSIILDKQVMLTPENDHETILIKATRVKLNSDELDPSKWKLKIR